MPGRGGRPRAALSKSRSSHRRFRCSGSASRSFETLRCVLRAAAKLLRDVSPASQEAATWDREHFLVVALDGKNRMLGVHTVSVGTLTASLVHPREVMKSLILANAAAFIVVRNHASGDPTPSAEDLAIKTRLKECAELFGMRLLDHVIIGHGRYCSMCNENLL